MSDFYIPNMDDLISLHNKARNGRELVKDDKLMRYASDWVRYMADRRTLKHSKMSNIMKLGFSRVGENIAYGQKNEESVMNTWLHSSGHRANIMSASFNRIGCDFAYSSNNTIYWCVCFGYESAAS